VRPLQEIKEVDDRTFSDFRGYATTEIEGEKDVRLKGSKPSATFTEQYLTSEHGIFLSNKFVSAMNALPMLALKMSLEMIVIG
jgi:hypothetical protein